MKKLLIALMFLPCITFANSLEAKLEQINLSLNPKVVNSIGYEVDYREENNYGWINITRVKLEETQETRFYLKNGKIESKEEKVLRAGFDYDYASKQISPLYQITCPKGTSAAECKQAFSKELTKEVVLEIVNRDIRDLILKVR